MTELSEPAVLSLTWQTEAETAQFAAAFATQLLALPTSSSLFLTLEGDLGAGKTTFTRYLLQAMGVTGRIKSPTYTIVESYDIVSPTQPNETSVFSHFDFYRFNDPHEWEEAGFRDIFASPGYKLAEWPEKAATLLPAADINMHLRPLSDDSREVRLQAVTSLGEQIVKNLAMYLK